MTKFTFRRGIMVFLLASCVQKNDIGARSEYGNYWGPCAVQYIPYETNLVGYALLADVIDAMVGTRKPPVPEEDGPHAFSSQWCCCVLQTACVKQHHRLVRHRDGETQAIIFFLKSTE